MHSPSLPNQDHHRTAVKVDLLEKAFKDIDHDARPVIGMVIRLETSLCEKIAISRQKVTLMLDTTGNKATLSIGN